MDKNITCRKALTLAETLITLVIISMIAIMTVPSVLTQTGDNELKVKMKREFYNLNQLFMDISDQNETFVAALSSCAANDHNCLKNLFKQNLNYRLDCDSGSNLGVCFPAAANIKHLDGTTASSNYLDSTAAGLALNDSASFMFFLDSPTCTSTLSPDANLKNRCGWIVVDVNGLQKPNVWGRDIYSFYIYDNMIRPSYAGFTTEASIAAANDCKTGTNKGYTCSSEYLKDK